VVRALDLGLENSNVSVYFALWRSFVQTRFSQSKITLILCEQYANKVDLYIHLDGYKEIVQKLSMITVISAVWT